MESIDVGLLALRVLVGLVFLGHGLAKVTTRFNGLGTETATGIFEDLGYRPGRPYLLLAAATELVAGLAFGLGLATPLAAAALIGVMVNAAGAGKVGKGPWYFNGGWEYDLTLAVMAAAVAFTGPGTASLDNALGWDPGSVAAGALAVAVGLASGLAVLALRARSKAGAEAVASA
jgi:putative oxidoreductase